MRCDLYPNDRLQKVVFHFHGLETSQSRFLILDFDELEAMRTQLEWTLTYGKKGSDQPVPNEQAPKEHQCEFEFDDVKENWGEVGIGSEEDRYEIWAKQKMAEGKEIVDKAAKRWRQEAQIMAQSETPVVHQKRGTKRKKKK